MRQPLLSLPVSLLLLGIAAAPLAGGCVGSSSRDGGIQGMDAGSNPLVDAGTWAEARIESPALHLIPESVAVRRGAPMVVPATSQVLFQSTYENGSWEVVLSSYDGAARRVLVSNTSAPGTFVTALQYVDEARVVLVLLAPSSTMMRGRLAAYPVDGSSPWTIDTNVATAQVSADGTRVNYVVSVPGGAEVRTATIASPQPMVLGTLDPQTPASVCRDALVRSRSAASNTPFFYLITGASDGLASVRPFGAKPPAAPTLKVETFFTCYGSFDSVDATANGRYGLVRDPFVGVLLAVIDTQRSTSVELFAELSSDATRWASYDGDTITLSTQEGTQRTFAGSQVGSLMWSPDGRLLAALSSRTTGCDNTIIDVAAGTTRSSRSGDCAVSSRSVVAFTRDDQSFIVRSGTKPSDAIEVASIFTGQRRVLSRGLVYLDSASPTVGGALGQMVDTGDGLVFPDGWGIAYASYDGSRWVRLDSPRDGETALDGGRLMSSTIVGVLAWDEAARQVVYQPVRTVEGVSSWFDAPRALDAIPLDGGRPTRLTPGAKMSGQIAGVLTDFTAFEAEGLILFNSADQSRGLLPAPAELWIGSLSGGQAKQLSALWRDGAPYGAGTAYGVWRLFGGVTGPTGVVYDEWGAGQTSGLTVQATDGSARTHHEGYELGFTSPDGTLALVTDAAGYPALLDLSLTPGAQSAPEPIAPGLRVSWPPRRVDSCPGCPTREAWAFAGPAGAFSRDGQLFLAGSLDGGPTSTFLLEQGTPPAQLTDLGVTAFKLFSDGVTAVGRLRDGTIVRFEVTSPTKRRRYPSGFVEALLPGLGAVVSDVTGELRKLDLQRGTSASLMASGLPAGGAWSRLEVSGNGEAIAYAYTSGRAAPDGTACGGIRKDYVLMPTTGNGGGVVVPDPRCDIVSTAVTADGAWLVYLSGTALFARGAAGGGPLSVPSERVARFWASPTGNLIVAQALTGADQWQYFAIGADGSSRLELGAPLPAHKQLRAVQFTHQGQAVLIGCDALTDGVLELFRFDLR